LKNIATITTVPKVSRVILTSAPAAHGAVRACMTNAEITLEALTNMITEY
jgi:hypothetical protein